MTPYISPQQNLPELTLKVILLAIVLALLLGATNTYLALKIGFLTSASIPAAVLSMGILRFFRNSNILENNLVQTGASAGEAVAGGIVYTIPALIILHYWNHFGYWENFCIAVTGGILGVIFSVPLRRVLMNEKNLHFPEGKAIAAVLLAGDKKSFGLREMLMGGAAGALIEFAQTGLQVIASSFQAWFNTGRTIVGFGGGFSATLIGAGYLIGFNIGLSILIGALITWFLGVPVLTYIQHIDLTTVNATETVMGPLRGDLRYVGIGAMLAAGIWTLMLILRPLADSLSLSIHGLMNKQIFADTLRTERDVPLPLLLIGLLVLSIFIYALFDNLFILESLGLATTLKIPFLLGCLLYVIVIGFIFAVICGYFSGLVGVSASPGSAVIIGGMFIAALLVRLLLSALHPVLSDEQLLNAAAITIIIGAVVTGAAAIANDNIQDLKVGHIVGSTPWKQQVMLILGVIVAASIVPPVMNLLFNVYGIADVLPHAGMDPTKTLAAPPAAAMAAITQAVFDYKLPWNDVAAGVAIVIAFIFVNQFLLKRRLSALAFAIGMYLPLASSIPLFIGSTMALIAKRALTKRQLSDADQEQGKQRSVILACGIVAGSALMDVALAIPFAMAGNPDIFKIMPSNLNGVAIFLGCATVAGLGYWFYKLTAVQKSASS